MEHKTSVATVVNINVYRKLEISFTISSAVISRIEWMNNTYFCELIRLVRYHSEDVNKLWLITNFKIEQKKFLSHNTDVVIPFCDHLSYIYQLYQQKVIRWNYSFKNTGFLDFPARG